MRLKRLLGFSNTMRFFGLRIKVVLTFKYSGIVDNFIFNGRRGILNFFLLLSVWHYANAQDSVASKSIFCPEINSYFGYLIPSYPGVPQNKYVAGLATGMYWQTKGRDRWHHLYRYPVIGLEMAFLSFSNQKELGYSMYCVPSLEYKSKKENSKWRLRVGFGVAYFNKPYDVITNPNNFYIGSRFTNMSVFSFYRKWNLYQHCDLLYGVSVLHSSNGHTALPNAGMNMICVQTAIRFNSTKAPVNSCRDSISLKKWSYVLKTGLGFHEFGSTSKPVGGPGYPSYHFSLWANKPYGGVGVLQAGITWAYYTSFYDYIISQEVYENAQHRKSCTGILFAGNEWVMGKVGFMAQAGIYFYNPFYIKQKKLEGTWDNYFDKVEALSTNRIGLVYYPFKKMNTLNKLNNQLQLGVFLKANLAQADLFEYSAAFVF